MPKRIGLLKKIRVLTGRGIIEALEQNDRPVRDNQLFANVAKRAQNLALNKMPVMKPVREAGHEGRSFYFIPKALFPKALIKP